MIAAIVTAYKPDAGFLSRFLPLLQVCNAIVVVDNTPGGHRFELPSGFALLQGGKNVGLAHALNGGLREAQRLGAREVVLFDQDSTPSPELIRSLGSALRQATAAHGPRCCVGPTHLDDGVPVGQRGLGPAVAGAAHALSAITCLPTSGMMFALEALAPDDTFSTALFLDLVDFEWCWRLRTRGWTFLRAADIRMYHRLGLAEQRFLGITYHVPAPYRHYFQVRDTLRLAARSYVPIYSKIRLVGVLPLKALIYPLLLDHGVERLRWMARGVLDCMRRVTGIGAAHKRLSC